MSLDVQNETHTNELPELMVEKRRGISLVWLIPIVAGLIGIWLAYTTISEMGPTITIKFKDGAGLEAGKTKVKYRAVEVGLVQSVDLIEDLKGVLVTAQLDKGAEPHLTQNTKFWVVRPRIGVGGISGLETLISGAYIEVDPRPGPLTKEFVGLDQPPGVKFREPGRKFVLQAHKLGGLHMGAPIFYRDIQVGEVLGNKLAEDGRSVLIDMFVRAPHHDLVEDTSRFWRRSGFQVKMDADGFDFRMESLAAVLAGGVAFETAATSAEGKPSEAGTVFALYDSSTEVGEAKLVTKRPYLIYFDGSVRGLKPGAPVEFRGIRVGTVSDIALEVNPKTMNVRIPVTVEIEPERAFPPEMISMREPYKGAEVLVKRGLRAQLKTGSLLTGALFVELDLHPDLPRKSLKVGGKYPEIPTVPATMDLLRRNVSDTLAEIRKIPFDKIGHELLQTLKGTNRIANSPEVLEAIRDADKALKDIQRLAQNSDTKIVSLAESAEKTLKSARLALSVVEPDSPVVVNLNAALRELSSASRSIRVLADYLERHPEALVRGKTASAGY